MSLNVKQFIDPEGREILNKEDRVRKQFGYAPKRKVGKNKKKKGKK